MIIDTNVTIIIGKDSEQGKDVALLVELENVRLNSTERNFSDS